MFFRIHNYDIYKYKAWPNFLSHNNPQETGTQTEGKVKTVIPECMFVFLGVAFVGIYIQMEDINYYDLLL